MVQKRNIEYELVLELLKRRKVHLRGASKLIACPHSTLYREVKKLKHRNVIEYETAGRNKNISLKKGIEAMYYIYRAEYYNTLKFMDKHPEFSIIFEQIIKKVGAGLIVLFGSYAKGTARKDSDIDIFVETGNRKLKETLKDIDSRISAKIGKFKSNVPLGKEIARNHIIIRGVELFYEKNPIFE